MFDIGIQELIIIFVIALLVFGPERLPEISRKLGKFVLQIRKGVYEAKHQMEAEFSEIDKKVEDDVSSLLKNVEPYDQNNKEESTIKKEDKT
jgi:Tat protein translocase TatB subunit